MPGRRSPRELWLRHGAQGCGGPGPLGAQVPVQEAPPVAVERSRGEPRPGTDVATVSPIPVPVEWRRALAERRRLLLLGGRAAMRRGALPSPSRHLRQPAGAGPSCVPGPCARARADTRRPFAARGRVAPVSSRCRCRGGSPIAHRRSKLPPSPPKPRLARRATLRVDLRLWRRVFVACVPS